MATLSLDLGLATLCDASGGRGRVAALVGRVLSHYASYKPIAACAAGKQNAGLCGATTRNSPFAAPCLSIVSCVRRARTGLLNGQHVPDGRAAQTKSEVARLAHRRGAGSVPFDVRIGPRA